MEKTIVSGSEWHDYEVLRDSWINVRLGLPIPQSLHPALCDRLGRRWWAHVFEMTTGRSIEDFVEKVVNTVYGAKVGCTQGRAYENRADLEAMQAAKEKGIFQCEDCGKFHLGARRDFPVGDLPIALADGVGTYSKVRDLFRADIVVLFDVRQIRSANLKPLRVFGEPLRSEAERLSLVGAIIHQLPEHAPYLLDDLIFPDLESSCVVRREDGTEYEPLELESKAESLGG